MILKTMFSSFILCVILAVIFAGDVAAVLDGLGSQVASETNNLQSEGASVTNNLQAEVASETNNLPSQVDTNNLPSEAASVTNGLNFNGCKSYDTVDVESQKFTNKKWLGIQSTAFRKCAILKATAVAPGLNTFMITGQALEGDIKISRSDVTRNLTPGKYLEKPIVGNSDTVANQTLVTMLFQVMGLSDDTMMTIQCPIEGATVYNIVSMWTTTGLLTTDATNFLQNAKQIGVNLTGYHDGNYADCEKFYNSDGNVQ